jgi:hypothetical protein
MGFWALASLGGALAFVIVYFVKTMGRKKPPARSS